MWPEPPVGAIVLAYFPKGSAAAEKSARAHPAIILATDFRNLENRRAIVAYGSSTLLNEEPGCWFADPMNPDHDCLKLRKRTRFDLRFTASLKYDYTGFRELEHSPLSGGQVSQTLAKTIHPVWDQSEAVRARPLIRTVDIPEDRRLYYSTLSRKLAHDAKVAQEAKETLGPEPAEPA